MYNAYFHRGLVGLYLADWVELLNARAWLDEPLDNLAFRYTCKCQLCASISNSTGSKHTLSNVSQQVRLDDFQCWRVVELPPEVLSRNRGGLKVPAGIGSS